MKEIWRVLAAFGLMMASSSACQKPEVKQPLQTRPLTQPYQPLKENLIYPSPTATTLKPEETSTFISIPTTTITPQPTFTPERKNILPEKITLTDPEQKMFEAVNKARQKRSLPLLKPSAPLTQIARERSEQASRVWGHFLHPTPTPGEKYALLVLLERHQLPYRRAGEILFRTNVKLEEVGSVGISKFLESPPHRDVLLDPRYLEIGIGHTRADEDQLHYFAIILGEP